METAKLSKPKVPLFSVEQHDFRSSLAYLSWSQDCVLGVSKILRFCYSEVNISQERLFHINQGLAITLEEVSRFMEESIHQVRKAHQEILEVQDSDKEGNHGIAS